MQELLCANILARENPTKKIADLTTYTTTITQEILGT